MDNTPALHVVRFHNKTSTRPFSNELETWSSLVERLREPRRTRCTVQTCEGKKCPHKNGPAWSPARYKADTSRGNAAVLEVTALVLDVDDATNEQVNEAMGRLRWYRYAVHASHRDRFRGERDHRCVRIVVELNRPVPVEHWPRVRAALVERLGIPADPMTKDLARIYFDPSRPSDAGYFFHEQDGEPLDVDGLLAELEAEKVEPEREPAPVIPISGDHDQRTKRAIAYLERMPPAIEGDNGSAALWAATCRVMHGFDLDDSTTKRIIVGHYNDRCDPPWSEREIDHKISDARGKVADPSKWRVEDNRSAANDNHTNHAAEVAAGGEDEDEDDEVEDLTNAKPRKKPRDAVKTAAAYVARFASREDGVLLRRWRGDFYRWATETGCYVRLTDDQVQADLYRRIGLGRRADVADVHHALIAVDDVLIDHAEIGEWLDETKLARPPYEIATCPNGLLHLPTGELLPATPRFFATSALGVPHVPYAPKATRWLAFLEQLWRDDPDSIAALQEWFGYLLVADTRQQKIMLLVGPKRSGKGTIARVLTALLGQRNVASPTLASLGTNFGLWPLIGRPACIIGDARLGSRSDIAQVVERLLSISGEDAQTVDRKHREPWTGRLSTRITIISNELPRFSDASDALAGRMLPLELRQSFYGHEDPTLSDALIAELPGILQWAIEGWRRLNERGRFVQPETSREVIDDLADLSSPVRAWAREVCRTDEPDQTLWLACKDAFDRYRKWCEENGHHAVSMTRFGSDVKTALGCRRKKVRRDHKFVPVYEGLVLK